MPDHPDPDPDPAPDPTPGPGPGRAPGPEAPPFRYTAALADRIETAWQGRWAAEGTFVTPNPGSAGFDGTRPKFYCLDMFPYPSGAGLHVGHPEGYTATDIVCRYQRMLGKNVLHPMGWDAFGLPAEQYAIQTGVHPAVTTRGAIDNFRRQLERFGFSYDWSREIATIDPGYYKWTQWIFLQVYGAWYDKGAGVGGAGAARPIAELVKALETGRVPARPNPDAAEHAGAEGERAGEGEGGRAWPDLHPKERRRIIDSYRLAYLADVTVNWCPKLGTVLANEEVINGRSERGSFPVHRRPFRQWMFRITAYAERLLSGLVGLDWPESTRTQQSEWIGKSVGAEIDFALTGFPGSLRVFTTRPDTLFGATYMVVAPEHPLVETALADPAPVTDAGPGTDTAAVRAYVEAARNRADVDRAGAGGEQAKTGVFTGLYAINPATGGPIPIWIADYVLMGYGHGAIMAVPAHDERDYAFAIEFQLPIRPVVVASLDDPCEGWNYGVSYDIEFSESISIATTGAEGFSGEKVTNGTIPGRRVQFRTFYFESPAQRDRFAATQPHASQETHNPVVSNLLTLDGFAINSSNADVRLDGLPTGEAKRVVIDWLERSGNGRGRTIYRLRDWLFSRQRYWGEPFPIVYDEAGDHYPVSEAALPVVLPELEDYQPVESADPTPLLGKATAWVNTTAAAAGVAPGLLSPGAPVRRETNTMPGWAGSCWYYLRYCDPADGGSFCAREVERYWMSREGAVGAGAHGGVDLYVGGAEHAVLHLLYARFWHKALFDLGHVSTPEPFNKLFHQGLITSHAYQREDKTLVATDLVDVAGEGRFTERATGRPVAQVVAKMSKSLKNVVNPDEVIAQYGADTFRLYEMYMGPLEATKPWNTRDIVGPHRFLQRVWRNLVDEGTGLLTVVETDPLPETARLLHKTIGGVRHDIEHLGFNTAIAKLIELNNHLTGLGADPERGGGGRAPRAVAEPFVLMLAPFAPHIAEELWSLLGHPGSLSRHPFPVADAALAADETVEVPVQIMGKVRSKVVVPAGADAGAIEAAALADPRIVELIAGKTVRKVIVVPGRMVNLVVG